MYRNYSIFQSTIAPWVAAFTIAGYPLITATSSLLHISNRPLSILARVAVLALAIACILFAQHKSTKKENFVFWLAWWIFWCAYVARLFIDQSLNPSTLQLPTIEYFSFMVGVCLLPSMAAISLDAQTGSKRIFNKLLWVAAIGLALNLNYIFSTSVELDSLNRVRAESDVLNPITIGHIGATIILLILWRLTNRKKLRVFGYLAMIPAVALAGTAIITSGSKGPLLALLLSVLFYAFSLPRQFFSFKLLFIGLALYLGVLAVLQGNPDLFLFSRISDGVFNDGIRLKLLTDSIAMIKEHPVLGSGIEPLGLYPHNLVLESFLLFGITTGLPFLFMLAFTFWKCHLIARRTPEQFWICLLFTQYFAGAMVSGSLYTSAALYTIMLLVVRIGTSESSARAQYKSH